MIPLDWPHAVRDIPSEGLAVDRRATPEEAVRLAEALDIVAVDQLVARYKLTLRSGGRVTLTGTLDAKVTQNCVISLEPVASAVCLRLDVVFTPSSSTADASIEGTLDDLESPDEEPIENGMVDVGRVVLEELTSGLDQYPRQEDARFDWAEEKGEIAANKPFAALARLRKPQVPD